MDQVEHAIVMKEPMVLAHGKTMPALLACSFKSPGILLGCDVRQGITLHHQVHDRGVTAKFVSALASHWQRAVQESSTNLSEQQDSPVEAGLLHWYSHCGCALHDAHNALRWAYETMFGKEASLQKALFAAMASYRQCLLPTFSCLGSWLVEVVEVLPDTQAPDEEHLLQLYSYLGTPASLLDELVSRLRLRWDPLRHRLQVTASFMALENSLEELSRVLTCLWRFQSFTASRWCTVGKSCRCYALCLVTGYMHLFSYAKRQGVLPSFESAGATDVPQSVHTFCMVMAFVSYLPEGFLAGLLADNRLLRQADTLEAAMQDELMQFEQFPPVMWQTLSGHVAEEAATLRHLVIWGSHIVYAYMDLKIFSVIGELPWCLARGDIVANLEALQSNTEPPADPFSQKIWALLVSGYPFGEIQAAVQLWSTASFTSHLTETLHASAALVRRHHPDYSCERLTQRAFLHIMRSARRSPPQEASVHSLCW